MANNAQSRKWQLTINNPHECGLTHETITEILMQFSPSYFCMGDERATTGTPHTHIFMFCDSPVRFSTIKNRFPTAHIEKAYGSALQNREYVMKSGKWEGDAKAETVVEGSFYEYGNIPGEKEEENPGMFRLLRNIREGMSTTEIIEDDPQMAFRIRDIDTIRQTLLSERYATENRDIETAYIFGASGAGKTRYIYSHHNPRDIHRITSYRGGKGVNFDGYHGQDVLVFEEFSSQVPIEEMLNILDIYPLFLPARYNDKVACFTRVYFTSNLPLSSQYKAVQWNQHETWRAFLQRIHKVIEYKQDGSVIETVLTNLYGGNKDGKQQKIQAGTADQPPLLPVAPQIGFDGPFEREE